MPAELSVLSEKLDEDLGRCIVVTIAEGLPSALAWVPKTDERGPAWSARDWLAWAPGLAPDAAVAVALGRLGPVLEASAAELAARGVDPGAWLDQAQRLAGLVLAGAIEAAIGGEGRRLN